MRKEQWVPISCVCVHVCAWACMCSHTCMWGVVDENLCTWRGEAVHLGKPSRSQLTGPIGEAQACRLGQPSPWPPAPFRGQRNSFLRRLTEPESALLVAGVGQNCDDRREAQTLHHVHKVSEQRTLVVFPGGVLTYHWVRRSTRQLGPEQKKGSSEGFLSLREGTPGSK